MAEMFPFTNLGTASPCCIVFNSSNLLSNITLRPFRAWRNSQTHLTSRRASLMLPTTPMRARVRMLCWGRCANPSCPFILPNTGDYRHRVRSSSFHLSSLLRHESVGAVQDIQRSVQAERLPWEKGGGAGKTGGGLGIKGRRTGNKGAAELESWHPSRAITGRPHPKSSAVTRGYRKLYSCPEVTRASRAEVGLSRTIITSRSGGSQLR
ncbi:hypothetical protein VTI74DRAFT_3120 [Chaetomium olivicolor]